VAGIVSPETATITRPTQALSVADHERFLESLKPAPDPFDSIDHEVAGGPTRRRKESEVNRLLAILDELAGKEGLL
jgi:hypothetical protein